MIGRIVHRIKKLGKAILSDGSWLDKTYLVTSLKILAVVLGLVISAFALLKYCSPENPSVALLQKNNQYCEGGKGYYFSTTLTTLALIDLDSGRHMDGDTYKRSDEYKMYLENEREGKKAIDENRLIKGFEIKLSQIQDGTMMLGHDGFPALMARKKSKILKFAADTIHSVNKDFLKSAVSDRIDGANQLEDGIWAVRTDRGNFVALEVKGLPPTKDYPFGSPKPTNVLVNWCLHEASWFEF